MSRIPKVSSSHRKPALQSPIDPPATRPRIAWGITGSGHGLTESLDLARTLSDVDLFISAAGAEVLRMYGHDMRQLRARFTIYPDATASAAPVAHFYHGVYDSVVIAPATSNTVAKCALGISDTLVTNIFAQAGKCRLPAIVFACDTEPEIETEAPREWVTVWPRRIDLAHVATLRGFEGVTVVDSVAALADAIRALRPGLAPSRLDG